MLARVQEKFTQQKEPSPPGQCRFRVIPRFLHARRSGSRFARNLPGNFKTSKSEHEGSTFRQISNCEEKPLLSCA